MKLVRFKKSGTAVTEYGIIDDDKIYPLKNSKNIGELFTNIKKDKIITGKPVPFLTARLTYPTDDTAQIYCTGLNYMAHAREFRAPLPKQPVFFSKARSSFCGAYEDIIRPAGVSLLDYEIELGVVIGRHIGKKEIIHHENIGDSVFGITIVNDLTAREIQLRSDQWFLGKSFRTFAPTGPIIQIMDEKAQDRLYSLNLELQVFSAEGIPNDNKRQSGSTGDMVFKIHDLINELREHLDLYPGDIIMTGTPSGVALTRPGSFRSRMAEIMGISKQNRIESLIDSEIKNNKRYLQEGDTLEARIFSDDNVVDLGEQMNRVVSEKVR